MTTRTGQNNRGTVDLVPVLGQRCAQLSAAVNTIHDALERGDVLEAYLAAEAVRGRGRVKVDE